MADRVIRVEVAAKPDEPELWVAFYRLLGETRRTLFAELESVKEAVRLDVAPAYKRQSLDYRFAEVPYDSLPFEEKRSALGPDTSGDPPL